jgi:hypothetical protein
MATTHSEQSKKRDGSLDKNQTRNKKRSRNISEAESIGDGWIEELFDSRKKEKQQKQDIETTPSSRQNAQSSKKSAPVHKNDGHGTKNRKFSTFSSLEDNRLIDSLNDNEWKDDGLGGVFDKEGYTGRKSQEGFKIFKKHLLNKKNSGKTPLCPFDCDCCFV